MKDDLNTAISEEVLRDRIKTAASERKQTRNEINDTLSNLEKTQAGPEHMKRNGHLIAAIEQARTANDGRDWIAFPQTPDEIAKISETRGITIAEAETILFAVRCSEMLRYIEGMKPAVMMALMGSA